MNLEDLMAKRTELDAHSDQLLDHMQALNDETERVADVAHNSRQINDDLDREFELQTELDKTDITFLLFATALQCVRQYLLTSFTQRTNDQAAAKAVKGNDEEHSNRSGNLYNPSLLEICTNPVPFDAINKSELLRLKGAKPLRGDRNHRYVTLGHDPVLGFIYGTANIATSTLTTWERISYHVKTEMKKDAIAGLAETREVFSHTFDKLLNQGIDGKVLVATSLAKEYIHLRSDISSTLSLPFPGTMRVSPKLARKLADYGVDMGNMIDITKQAVVAQAVNMLIMMLHGMCFYLQTDQAEELLTITSYRNISTHKVTKDLQLDLHKVKTRKILMYSNVIASSSNVLYVALQKDISKLDVGGIAVTLYRLVNDRDFIRKVKEEFIQQRWHELIQGDAALYNPASATLTLP